MVAREEVYKCEVCGNIVEVLVAGGGELVCCGQPMNLLEAKTEDEGNEKHKPVLEITEEGDLVKVGSVPHPMEDAHYIQWIGIKSVNGKSGRKYLNPGDAPQALFEINKDEIIELSEYCNVHGLWKNKIK